MTSSQSYNLNTLVTTYNGQDPQGDTTELNQAEQIINIISRYMLQATELFDLSYQVAPNILDNNYLDNSGVLHSLNIYSVSDYIAVTPNIIHVINQSDTGQGLFGCWYDTNKQFIRGFNGLVDIAPANAAYARININKNITFSNYSFTANVPILDVWTGKKGNFLGDSITYGYNGGTPYSNNFPALVGQMLGLSVVRNYGASGTAIQTNAADGQNSQSFINRYMNMSNDADLIFVFGGTNDFGHNLPLGNAGNVEIDTLTITTGATASGNISLTLNGTATTTAVTAGDNASTIASKIAATLYNGWNAKATGNSVAFTKATTGTNTAPSFSDTGATGTAANFAVTTAGTAQDTADGTFYGALNVLMTGLLKKYPHKTIVFATPLHRNYTDSGQFGPGEVNKSGYTLKQYADAIKTVAQQYGLPVLDFYSNSGLNPNNSGISTLYFVDGLHPNQTGHNLLASKITRFLRTI